MRTIPVDTQALGSIKALSVEAKVYEGVQSKNFDGVAVWKVQCLITPDEGKPELVEVSVASSIPPVFSPLQEITFEGLVARHWEMGSRSGVSFSAQEAA